MVDCVWVCGWRWRRVAGTAASVFVFALAKAEFLHVSEAVGWGFVACLLRSSALWGKQSRGLRVAKQIETILRVECRKRCTAKQGEVPMLQSVKGNLFRSSVYWYWAAFINNGRASQSYTASASVIQVPRRRNLKREDPQFYACQASICCAPQLPLITKVVVGLLRLLKTNAIVRSSDSTL